MARQVRQRLVRDAKDDPPGIVRPPRPAPLESELLTLQRAVGNRTATEVLTAGQRGPIGVDGGDTSAETETAINQARRSGGRPLDQVVRNSFERAFGGADFSGVKLHRGPAAADLNERVQAKAFTLGQDIFLGAETPTSGREGQELLAHELTHTIQQSGGAAHGQRVMRKKKAKKAPAQPLDFRTVDWVKYSKVFGKSRSPELKKVDAALLAAQTAIRDAPGNHGGVITAVDVLLHDIAAWRNSKTGVSYRDNTVNNLAQAAQGVKLEFETKRDQQQQRQRVATEKHASFGKLDDELSKHAVRDQQVTPDMFMPGSSYENDPVIKKKNDGTLTDEALDELDEESTKAAQELMTTARKQGLQIEEGADLETLKGKVGSDKNTKSGRTNVPELQNFTEEKSEGQGGGETTAPMAVAGSSIQVVYDPTDVHSEERIASLKAAITAINQRSDVKVPALTFYLPKYGRSIFVSKDCTIKVMKGINDAIFHPPAFIAVSSAVTGSPKTDEAGGKLKFLSTQLGPNDALKHSFIHEIGHAMHYGKSRQTFYNLKYTALTMENTQMAMEKVSQYGTNPREFVAEVFLGRVMGRTFDNQVMTVYQGLRGPELKGD